MNKNILIIWLKTSSVLTICFGLIASFASHAKGSGIWLFLFDLLNWPIDGQPSVFSPDSYAINAVVGGVMFGWGTLMYLLSCGPIAKGDIYVTRSMLISIILWFLVDSSGSFVAGLY